MRIPLEQWTPDLSPLVAQDQLQVARNVLPKTGGYAPMPSLSNLNSKVLPFAPRGAYRGKAADGTNLFFAGVEDTTSTVFKIFHFKPTDVGGGVIEYDWVDVSKAAGYLSIGVNRRCEFAQSGQVFVCASYTNATQALNLSTGLTFEDIPGAPRAHHAAVGDGPLWLGDLYANDLGVLPNAVAWSAFNNPLYFPTPGTDEATAVLSGRTILEGDGGPVQAIVPGAEVVAIFQQEAIWRADFIGGDVVWDFDNVVENVGCLVKGAAVAIERGVFFLSQDGWRLFNYTASENIGKDRVNDWFFEQYDPDYPEALSIARDPKQTRVWVSFAAKGNSGVPNRVMVYDWKLDRFSYGETTVYSMIGAGQVPPSLDSPDVAGDRDVLEDDLTGSGDLNYGILSFDDRVASTAIQAIGGFDSTFRLAEFAGANLAGVVQSGWKELAPGSRAFLSGVRGHVIGSDVKLQVAGIQDEFLEENTEDLPELDFGTEIAREKNGLWPIRLDARYHAFRINLGSQWREAGFYDAEFRPSGSR